MVSTAQGIRCYLEPMHYLARRYARYSDCSYRIRWLWYTILKLTDIRHPFLLFERELKKDLKVGSEGTVKYHKGDHVFIMNDATSSCCLRFGDGERECPGQSVAMLLLTSLLTKFRRQKSISFQP